MLLVYETSHFYLTVAKDPRIDELQETIITKDAKLNAMRNTIAVRNDHLHF